MSLGTCLSNFLTFQFDVGPLSTLCMDHWIPPDYFISMFMFVALLQASIVGLVVGTRYFMDNLYQAL